PSSDALRCWVISAGVMGVSVPVGGASSVALACWLSASIRMPGAIAQADSRQEMAKAAAIVRILPKAGETYAGVEVVIKGLFLKVLKGKVQIHKAIGNSYRNVEAVPA